MPGQDVTVRISPRTISTIVIIGVVIIGLWLLRDIVLILLTAIVITSFVEYIVARLRRYHLPRVFSVILVYVVSLTVLAGLFYVLVPILTTESSKLIDTAKSFAPDNSFLNSIDSNAVAGAKDIFNGITHNDPSAALISEGQAFISNVSGGFLSSVSGIFGGILNLILIVVISFYLSLQERGIEQFLLIITPKRHQNYVVDLWQRAERKIGLWMKGQFFLGLMIGTLAFIGLSVIGVHYALMIAIITAVAELVPYGIVVAMIPAVLFAFLDGGFKFAIIVAIFYFILHQIEVYIIVPLVMKRVVGISPLVVIIALLAGIKLAGFWGLILSIPVAVLLLEYINDSEKRKLITEQPV